MAKGKKLNIVLAGQANVGKSVIFNYLTGLHQHIGNWPGKTVEKAEGTLHYKGHTIDVLDLPGIYSLTTYSLEELISRKYIALEKPDFIVNVIDGTNLERNLIFTLQVLELEMPTVLAVNFVNFFKKKGIKIDWKKFREILGTPAVPVAAILGKGINEVLDQGMGIIIKKIPPKVLKYGPKVEKEIERLIEFINFNSIYPKRWLAIKLLEKDKEIEKLVAENSTIILGEAGKSISRLEGIYGQDSSIIITSERCRLVSKIIKGVFKVSEPSKMSFGEKLDVVTTHKIWGYPILVLILFLMFESVFKFGSWLSSVFEKLFFSLQVQYENFFGVREMASLGWAGVESALSLISIAIPYIVPFYVILYILEGGGYLARLAFLTDSFMHKLGVHGKACIPLILGYGCNVPACLACRIMETQRERLITGVLTTFVPCSAVTVVIMGLVGRFVGSGWAFTLYLFNLLVILILGVIISKIFPGEPTELLMEMPDYRWPHLKTVFLQAWFRLKDFLFIAAPLVIVSGVIIQWLYLSGWLTLIADFLKPITVGWLGLPAITGVLLIFGILRKELILVMLATLLGTTNFALILDSRQIITLAAVGMFYIPCVATISAFWREFGWKKAMQVTIFKIIFAIFLGGLIFRLLKIIGL